MGEPTELALVHDTASHGMTAYERLLGEAMEGDPTLFSRQDAVEAAWAIVDQVLGDERPVEQYECGSWGPAGAGSVGGPSRDRNRDRPDDVANERE